MFTSTFFPVLLILATLLCALTTGLLFTFAVVTMPGIKLLKDDEFIRTFQVMDSVIQNNHPLFLLAWLGSVVILLLTSVLGLNQLDPVGKAILLTATLLYLLGVQMPTGVINVPLNNQLQSLDVGTMNHDDQVAARLNFESRWNRWNKIRTAVAILVTTLLMLLLFLL